MQFNLNLNIDVAEQQVQQAINGSGTYLPPDLPTPPLYAKVNPADTPILTLALTSQSRPLTEVEDLADTRLAPRISQLPGVGLVSITGGQKPSVRIQTNPTTLLHYGLNLEDLRSAITASSVNQAKGSFDGPHQAFQIGANDQLLSASDYARLVVAYRNGAPVKLSDVADVVEQPENVRQAAWMNESPAVILNIQRQPGANIISVVDQIKILLPQLTSTLPASVHVAVLTDRTETIRASVADVEFELVLTVALVVMVIFLFLRHVSATIIPSVAVPLSIIGTFAVMYLLGYSLNNLTLMALTISTGFVVDDAIVMIENIDRFIEEGETPLRAALRGAEQIGFTIISLTVSLIAVLIPLLFMGNIVGRLFREFAVTLAVTILVSAVVSLTLTPMMSARLLRYTPPERQGWFYRASERVLHRVIDFYGRTLKVVLRYQMITLLVALGTLLLTVLLFVVIPKGFFPVQDTGVIQGVTEAAQTVSFPKMSELQQQVTKVILQDPAVESLSSFIGIDQTNSTLNNGNILINLKPLEERGVSASEVIHRLQPKLATLSGITLYMQPVQDITVSSRATRTQYQYTLEDPNVDELNTYASKMVARLRQMPALRDVASDQSAGGLRAQLVYDRDTASRFGITPSMINQTLYDSFGQRQISTMFTQLNQYHVVLELKPYMQRGPVDLHNLYIRAGSAPAGSSAGVVSGGLATSAVGGRGLTSSPAPSTATSPQTVIAGSSAALSNTIASSQVFASGSQVPLSAFSHMEETTGPISVNHLGQFPVVTISFNVAQGTSLGEAIDAVNQVRQEVGLPASMQATFQGSAAAFQASLANEPMLILAAIITVYIVLGVLYESYIHPVTILSTLPSAGVGALLALMLTGHDFDIISLIGIVLLIGIVKKNAIMMIDFALEAERTEGRPPQESIYQAALLRFRPIMMTTMAALLGAVPLAFGTGTGSELRSPLGISIIGGLVFSQLLTLYTTPVVYLWFDRLARRFRREGTSPAPEPSPAD
jgi:multidrug efflux pump